MKVRIDVEGDPLGIAAALEFAETHVIVSRADLERIREWAKSHRLLGELKRLQIKSRAIAVAGARRKRLRR